MARRVSRPTATGTRLPPDWRTSVFPAWKAFAMVYSVPQAEYKAEAQAFERANVGVVREDWKGEFKAWCRKRCVERFESRKVPIGLFSD